MDAKFPGTAEARTTEIQTRQGQREEIMKEKEAESKKLRGVFEKEPGSGEWWIQYFDAVGSKSVANKLVEKRRSDARAGIKMPDNFRAAPVTFRELAKDAL